MIGITLNGEKHELSENISIFDLIHRFKLDPEQIVVQLNNGILEKKEYQLRQIQNNDRIELIKFMAGG
ncbi:MAG: sulfur carrier protein ThiS [Candidatus Margulisiibacteriota bacterium]